MKIDHVIHRSDPEYPAILNLWDDAPPTLYCAGHALSLLNREQM